MFRFLKNKLFPALSKNNTRLKAYRSIPQLLRLEDRLTPSAPSVISINRVNGTVASNSAAFAVVFSEPVTGVEASDFTTVVAGNVAWSSVSVTGSGATYTVTFNGVTGNGTLGLNLVDNGSIRDVSGNPLYPANANASFGAPTFFFARPGPNSVTLGDVNADGKLDIVTGNSSGNDRVNVLLGNGNGTFADASAFSTVDFPSSVVLGDVNGDGKLDIVAAINSGNNASVFLGNGNGTFLPQTNFAVGSRPASVTLGDVNGDGKLDIVTANNWGNNATVLLGNGNGTFLPQTNFAVGGSPNSVILADVNGDGKLDIVAANSYGSTTSVLLGNGNGTFATQATFAVGSGPSSVDLGDVNGDGKLDIVTVNRGSSYSTTVLLGNGNGTFATQATFPAGTNPVHFKLGDINADGRLDIVTANYSGANVGIHLNNLIGNFSGQTYIIDNGLPTLVISTNKSSLGAGETAILNFTLSESATNFSVNDITIAGGTLTAFSGSGSTYTAIFTPYTNSIIIGTVDVGTGTFTDDAGNSNIAATQLTISVDCNVSSEVAQK